MNSARINIQHALNAGQPDTAVCRRVAEISISVVVTSAQNGIAIDNPSVDDLLETLRKVLRSLGAV